jgi:hypothetical protein
MLQKKSFKNSFYEKIKMFKKGPFVVESFITVGLFDCDHTQLEVGGKPKGNIKKTHLEQTNCKH